jgi:hypothetical protein
MIARDPPRGRPLGHGRVGGQGACKPKAVRLVNRWLLGHRVVLVLLLIAVWDMIFRLGL